MEEKELIEKIKQLKNIEPNKEWVVLAKAEILNKKARAKSVRESRWGWLFSPVKRPVLVFAFRGAMAAMVILAGAFFYMYYLDSHIPQLSLSNISLSGNRSNKAITASLSQVQESLRKINSSLKELGKTRNYKNALTMSVVVKATAAKGKEMIDGMKKASSSKKVLASLEETGKNFENIYETSSALQKEIIKRELEDLKTRSLSKDDQERLAKAVEYYRQGKDEEAMILITTITDK